MSEPRDTNVCELLTWDSRWFGMNIARLKQARVTAETLSLALSWCRVQRIRCLCLLADTDDFETASLAAQAGFVPVDIRVTLAQVFAQPLTATRRAEPGVREFRPEDLPALKAIAARLHTDTRFFFDQHFPRARSEAMYETWLEKCAENPHGWINVAECDGRPAGYVACGLAGNEGRIDLLGVAEWAQGNGLGHALLVAALDGFTRRGAKTVSVVTQFRNVKSLHLYQTHGFRVASLQQWYHKWFEHDLAPRELPPAPFA